MPFLNYVSIMFAIRGGSQGLLVVGVVALVSAAFAVFMSRFIYRKVGCTGMVAFLITLFSVCLCVIMVHGVIVHIEHPKEAQLTGRAALHSLRIYPTHHGFSTGLPSPSTSPFKLGRPLPFTHMNPWLASILLVGALLIGLSYLVYRGLAPRSRALLLYRLRSRSGDNVRTRQGIDTKFPLVGVEVGIDKKSGRPITIDGKDRFINTLVVGSIGTGKTSRILSKGAYQDLRHIARGVPMDLIVMDPDGGLVASVLRTARRLGIGACVIDLRGEIESNISLNPFAGGDISDIVDNVRAVLREQMGDQDGFFQAAQDDLVRTVIQVQVPIWPETDFLRFSELVTDPMHFRAVCHMIYEHAMQRTETGKGRKQDQLPDMETMWASERVYIERRYDEMNVHTRSMVLSAARSFLMDTRSEQKLEHLEKITKGLKIVVSELSTNERLRQVLGKSHLTTLDFPSFLASGSDVPGRLVAIVTGNRPTGNLFGKLFLVTLKMHALARTGDENTRRPLYCYIDEFPRFATSSLSDLFAQGRKYRMGMTMAIQTRAQLQLASNKGFVDVVEGSCRNKIYFPAPAPADAKYLQEALGTVKMAKESYSENKLAWYFFDGRRADRKVTTREDIDPRFRIEDLLFTLEQDEAVYLMTVDNQARPPVVGYTSYAEEWVSGQKQFFHPGKASSTPPRNPTVVNQRFLGPELKSQQVERTCSETSHASLSREGPVAPLTLIDVGTRDESSSSNPSLSKDIVDIKVTNLAVSPPKERDGHSIGQGDKPVDSTADAGIVPTYQRVDLRSKLGTPESVSTRSPKLCPKCQTAYLEMTVDARKWRCPQCGFDRKNRT